MIKQQKANMDKGLLSVLACPKCKGNVRRIGRFLICKKCELAFPILENKTPDMLLGDALELNEAKRHEFRHSFRL